MSWREDLRQASFRGVKFFVESHQISVGRRGVTHEFAQREKPYGEDTGRKARSFSIEGYILGEDYFSQRDALIEAFEAEGPGELIHPYLGRQIVNCFGGASIRETSKDGRMAFFSVTLEEAGEVQYPSVTADSAAKIGSSSDSLIGKAKAALSKKFNISGMPKFGFDSATSKVKAAADLVSSSSKLFSARNESLANLSYAVRNLKSSVNTLVATPSKLADQMAENFRLLTEISSSPREIFGSLKSMFSFGSDDSAINSTTATRLRQAANAAALNELVQLLAISEASRMAAEIEYESTEDAAEVKNALTEKIDEQMESADDDDVFAALQDLRGQIVRGVPPPTESLAVVSKITNQITLPSLVLAYQIYEAPEMEEDLIARNQVQHPGFIPGGQELEVLQLE